MKPLLVVYLHYQVLFLHHCTIKLCLRAEVDIVVPSPLQILETIGRYGLEQSGQMTSAPHTTDSPY